MQVLWLKDYGNANQTPILRIRNYFQGNQDRQVIEAKGHPEVKGDDKRQLGLGSIKLLLYPFSWTPSSEARKSVFSSVCLTDFHCDQTSMKNIRSHNPSPLMSCVYWVRTLTLDLFDNYLLLRSQKPNMRPTLIQMLSCTSSFLLLVATQDE